MDPVHGGLTAWATFGAWLVGLLVTFYRLRTFAR